MKEIIIAIAVGSPIVFIILYELFVKTKISPVAAKLRTYGWYGLSICFILGIINSLIRGQPTGSMFLTSLAIVSTIVLFGGTLLGTIEILKKRYQK